MPTSNTPMTAAQMLAQADTMADAIIRSKRYSDPVRVMVAYEAAVATAEAYLAARSASPRTLEEALMIDEALAFGRVTGDDDGTAEWAIKCRMARQRHARRLAEEGGGK